MRKSITILMTVLALVISADLGAKTWVKPRGWNPVSQEEEKEKRLGRSERTFVSHDEEFGFYPK